MATSTGRNIAFDNFHAAFDLCLCSVILRERQTTLCIYESSFPLTAAVYSTCPQPSCFPPRAEGSVLCFEYLSVEDCSRDIQV